MDVALGSSRDATEHVNRNNNDGYHAGQNVHHGGRGDFRGRGGRGGKGRGRGHNKNYKQRSINRDGALSTPRFPDQNQGRGGRGGGRGKGRYKKRLPGKLYWDLRVIAFLSQSINVNICLYIEFYCIVYSCSKST